MKISNKRQNIELFTIMPGITQNYAKLTSENIKLVGNTQRIGKKILKKFSKKIKFELEKLKIDFLYVGAATFDVFLKKVKFKS